MDVMAQPKGTTEQKAINEQISVFYAWPNTEVEGLRELLEDIAIEHGLIVPQELPEESAGLGKYENLVRMKHLAEMIGVKHMQAFLASIAADADEEDYSDIDEKAVSL